MASGVAERAAMAGGVSSVASTVDGGGIFLVLPYLTLPYLTLPYLTSQSSSVRFISEGASQPLSGYPQGMHLSFLHLFCSHAKRSSNQASTSASRRYIRPA